MYFYVSIAGKKKGISFISQKHDPIRIMIKQGRTQEHSSRGEISKFAIGVNGACG